MKTLCSMPFLLPAAGVIQCGLLTFLADPAWAVSEKFTVSGTFTPPAGVTSITVECWGGGGAGGGAEKVSGGNVGGGGGGGGAYAKRLNVPVTPGTLYTVTIPPVAVCPATGFVDGQRFDGAAVSFAGDGGVTVTANGGEGGACRVSTGTANSGASGAGGVISGLYEVEWPGGNGQNNTTAGNGGSGGGGASDLAAGKNATNQSTGLIETAGSDADHKGGRGANGKSAEGAGNVNNTAPGGGGGGAKDNTSGGASYGGGPGAPGQIIISYEGGTIAKANNSNDLNLGSSWIGGQVPSAIGTAQWASVVTSANTTVLGADTTWGSLIITDPAAVVTINPGSTLTNNGRIDMAAATADLTLNCSYVMGNSNTFDVAAERTLRIGGAIAGTTAANLTKAGDGRLVLAGPNSYAGNTVLSGGSLQLGADDVLPDGPGKGNFAATQPSVVLDLHGHADTVNGFTGRIDNTAAGTIANFTVGANDQSGSISLIESTGADSIVNVTKTGSGSLVLSGANTFTGSLAIRAGSVNLQNARPLDTCAGITMSDGTVLGFNNGSPTVTAPVILTGPVAFRINASNTRGTFSGVISGTGDLTIDTATNTVSGDPRIILAASNSFTGNVTVTTQGPSVSAMTLQLGAANALPATASVTLDGLNGLNPNNHFADLDLGGFDQTLAGLSNVARPNRTQRVYSSGGPATLTVNAVSDCDFGGTLGHPLFTILGFRKSGAGRMTLSGASTYEGDTVISGGTLALGVSDALPGIYVEGDPLADPPVPGIYFGATAVTVGSATLDAGTFTDVVGTLDVSGAAVIQLGEGGALEFAGSSALDWSDGSLSITGSFVSGVSLRFGRDGKGLSPAQLARITVNGTGNCSLDASGFLVSGATPSDYDTWSGGAAFDADANGDGVSNGLAWILGAADRNAHALSLLPAITAQGPNVTFSFQRIAAAVNPKISLVIETGSSLTAWPTVYQVGADTAGSSPGITIARDLPAQGFDTVSLTLPATPGSSRFARLRATRAP